jgi:hypothetical protein
MSSDSTDLWAPDSPRPPTWATDYSAPLTLGQAVDLFLAAKAAEGAAAKTISWYRMILTRLVRSAGADRRVDSLDAAALRAWVVELRSTLSPVNQPNGR